ncbi:MAG: hypothetical protein V3T72_07770 [Thermoanaerobaculia bacterium]
MEKSADERKNHPHLVVLRRWLKLRGLSHEDLGKEWGFQRGAALRRLHGKTPLGVFKFDKALARLGITRGDFDRGVAAGFHPELVLGEIAAENSTEVDDFGGALRRDPPRRTYAPEELRELAEGLEALRFREPEEARQQALDILRTADLEPDVAGEAWGVVGVLERYQGRPSVTAFCLGEALRAGGSARTKARTLQRIAMLLLFHAGDTDLALEAVWQAADLYRRNGDLVGLGMTLVDEGIVLGTSGAHREALAAHEAALGLLGDEAYEHRIAALQGLAISAVYLGDAGYARKRLDEALTALDGEESSFIYAALLWLKGEIALLLDQHIEAAGHFLGVWDCYIDLDMGPVETTLISLRMAKAYCLQGDRRQVRWILHEILSKLDDVERANPLLGSALGEFLRETARGEISAELLEQIYREMRGATEAVPPLLPLTLPAS